MSLHVEGLQASITGRYWDSQPHSVTFEAQRGTITALVGARGTSKSALALAIGRLIPDPVSGLINGTLLFLDSKGQPRRSERAAVLTPDAVEWPVSDTVFGEIAFALENTAADVATISNKVRHMARLFDLEHKLYSHPRALSGGQKQRLAIASQLVTSDPTICFDEPFRGLDREAAQVTVHLMSELRKAGRTILVLAGQISPELRQLKPEQFVLLSNHASTTFASEARLLEAIDRQPIGKRPHVWTLFQPLEREAGEQKSCDVQTVHKTGSPEVQVSGLMADIFQDFVVGPIVVSRSGGGVTAILGPNGSGKTSFAKLVVWPNSSRKKIRGSIKVRMQGTNKNLHCFYMAQDCVRHFSRQTCAQELTEIGFSDAEAGEVLADYGIVEVSGIDPFSIAKPKQQLLALALAEGSNASVVFLDEPTSSLDAAGIQALLEALHRYRRARRRVFLITHDIDFAASAADDALVFNNGRIVFDGDVRSLPGHEEYRGTEMS